MTPTDKVRAALELGRKMSEYHGTFEDDAQIDEALSLMEGHVIVPVEPTEEMRIAWNTSDGNYESYFSAKYYSRMIAPYVKGGTE